MPDRDEVIKDGERAIAMLGEVEEPTHWCDFIRVSFENALALLREQEPAKREFMRGVKPEFRRGVPSCGKCGRVLANHYRNCPWCGYEVNWVV